MTVSWTHGCFSLFGRSRHNAATCETTCRPDNCGFAVCKTARFSWRNIMYGFIARFGGWGWLSAGPADMMTSFYIRPGIKLYFARDENNPINTRGRPMLERKHARQIEHACYMHLENVVHKVYEVGGRFQYISGAKYLTWLLYGCSWMAVGLYKRIELCDCFVVDRTQRRLTYVTFQWEKPRTEPFSSQ